MRYNRYVKYNQIYNIFQVKNQKKGSSIVCNFVNYMFDPFSRNTMPYIVHPHYRVFQGLVSNDQNQDFNIIISNQFEVKTDGEYMDKMIANFHDKDVETVWYNITTNPEENDVNDFAKQFNLTLNESMMAMIYKLKYYKPGLTHRNDITIRQVANDQVLADFLSILQDTFGPQSQD